MPVKKTIQGTTYTITKAPSGSGKKLEAKYTNKTTGNTNTIRFGDASMEQYKDKTGIWSHKDHNDKKRRDNYHSRHRGDNLNKPSAGLLSMKLLW